MWRCPRTWAPFLAFSTMIDEVEGFRVGIGAPVMESTKYPHWPSSKQASATSRRVPARAKAAS